MLRRIAIAIAVLPLVYQVASATVPLVKITLKAGPNNTIVTGRVLARASDGLLVESRSGRLWTVASDELVAEKNSNSDFAYFDFDEMGDHLKSELSAAGVSQPSVVVKTEHYVVCSTAGRIYAVWAGQLLERLYKAFRTYWKSRGFAMPDPQTPLPVLLLGDRNQFAQVAQFDKTPGSAKGNGYFLVTANRIVLFDLMQGQGQAAKTVSQIQKHAQQIPGSVGAVVHEATHQIAFNTGLHTRYADNPIWLTEGMAMYFETPDLKSRRGWTTIGRINQPRLARYLDYLRNRKGQTALAATLQNNRRFISAESALDAYAESWALSYFLLKTKNRDYVRYLKQIAAKPRLKFGDEETRQAEFEAIFGDIDELDSKLQAFAHRLRR